MTALYLILYAIALLCFLVDGFWPRALGIKLLSVGLAAWVLVYVIATARALG